MIDEKSTHIDYSFAKRHRVFIDKLVDASYSVICCNPDIVTILELRRLLQAPLIFTNVSESEFYEKMAAHYENVHENKLQIEKNLHEKIDVDTLLEEIPDNEDILESKDGAPIIKLINALIGEAIKLNASDIHFEVFQNAFVVRFRVDGILHETYKPPQKLSNLIVSRIKVMAKLDIAEKKMPQDGRISINLGGKMIDIRVAVLPSNHGERVVLRILDKRQANLELSELGAREETLNKIRSMISYANGMILVTGPTGSGKTTTLYAAINALSNTTRNILTIEDPVEYDLPGIGQTQVNPKVGMTFAKGLRAILRQDPDIIMVGEIRDKETANIAIESSLTGHLVLSTLHTNNALGAIIRLEDMGVQPYLLSSCLIGVIAQRLVRKLCPHCKAPVELRAKDAELLGVPFEQKQIFEAKGCAHCNNLGYRGRIGLYEILMVDEEIKKMIHDMAPEQTMKGYVSTRTASLAADGYARMLEGVTTLEEVFRVTNISSNGVES